LQSALSERHFKIPGSFLALRLGPALNTSQVWLCRPDERSSGKKQNTNVLLQAKQLFFCKLIFRHDWLAG
jgi:hypothetical protein